MNPIEVLGTTIIEQSDNRLVLHTPVSDMMLQPNNILHGGMSAYLAETAASQGAAYSLDAAKQYAVGVDLTSTHLLPVSEGDTIKTVACALRNTGRVRVWKVEQFRVSDGEMFNVSQLTLYVKNIH